MPYGGPVYSGIPGAGSYYRPYDPVGAELASAPQSAQQAAEYTGIIEGGAPEGIGEYIDPAVGAALSIGLSGGMSDAETTAETTRLGQSFNRAIGGLSTATAKRGYYSPHSVAQAAAGRPTRALGEGLASLSAKREAMKRESRTEAGRLAGSLYQYPARASEARQSAYGQAFARFQQPNQRPQIGVFPGQGSAGYEPRLRRY